MKGKVLVAGGAGYIGAHTCMLLAEGGYEPVVFDNLSSGHEEFVRWGAFERGDIRHRDQLSKAFKVHKPIAVVHFAGLIEVGESARDPVAFYDNNVIGSLNLASLAVAHDRIPIVFSSTCATYGAPVDLPIDEAHPQSPLNPYGRTKLIVESALKDFSLHLNQKSVVLRYFNAAGADPEGRIGEWHNPETHAVPLAIRAALTREAGFAIFGTDYPTRDGTCIRDYVHVLDLARAHVDAVDYLLAGGDTTELNLGTGTGTTVRELIAKVAEVSGRSFETRDAERRAGDALALVADNRKAEQVLGWRPRYDLTDIVRSAWHWHTRWNQAY